MAQNRKISIIPNCKELSQHSIAAAPYKKSSAMQMHIQSCPCAFQFIMAASLVVSVPSLPSAFSAALPSVGKKGAQKSKCEVMIHLYYFLLTKVNVKSLENTEKIGNNIPKKEDGEISHWQKSM